MAALQSGTYYAKNRTRILAAVKARAVVKREEIAEYKKAWHAKNRERITAAKRAAYVANREEISVKHKAMYAANSDRIKARAKAYRDANPIKVKATRNRCVKAWRIANPEKAAEVCARRRARVLKTQSDPVDYKKILIDSNGQCGICKTPLDLLGTEFDHIIPLAVGGTHTTENIQAAHAYCNRVKGAKVA